jgi:DNA excision repair protein ERCC-2
VLRLTPRQVLAELHVLQSYRETLVGPSSQILAIGLSSRKNMCIHPKVRGDGKG